MPRLDRAARPDALALWARQNRRRRLATSREVLARERERLPLLADQIAEIQPTPAARLRQIDREVRRRWKERGTYEEGCYRSAIRLLRHHSPAERRAFAQLWRGWTGPRTGVIFLHRVRALLVDAKRPGTPPRTRGTYCG